MPTTPEKWTVVQHSAAGYNHPPDQQFAQGLEVRPVTTKREQNAVVKAGGLLFDSYHAADEFCDVEMYPPGVEGLIPRAPGTFSSLGVDGLSVYIPARDHSIIRWVEGDEEMLVENLPPKDSGEFLYGEGPRAIAHDNERRATFAAEAVTRFSVVTGLHNGGETVETAVSDLVGDLMHLCDSAGLSWKDVLGRAEMHYEAERQGHWG